jgi:hypothetical protein
MIVNAEDEVSPIRRVGLEQEFFLVDEAGVLRNEADRFLRRCRTAAEGWGLDPACFKEECVRSLVEIVTPPVRGVSALSREYFRNVRLALGVGKQLGLRLYPLGTYPLPTAPVVRDDPDYQLKARVIGRGRFLHAGRCAGVHLHLELPPGTVWPEVKACRDAPADAREELLDLYNLATALDPALVALTRSCPFYQGKRAGLAARTARYRGGFGPDGVYTNLREVGALQPYAASAEDLIEQERRRYRAWFGAMDAARVDRRLFARTKGNLYRASWNPVRLNRVGTVELRSMDANYPEVVLAVSSLVADAAQRIRREGLRVRPARGVRTLRLDGGVLLVPEFAHLSGTLLRAAVAGGTKDPEVVAYLDSFLEFATARTGRSAHLTALKTLAGDYDTTELEILRSFPPATSSVTPEVGLRLVREACEELERQVFSLHERHCFGTPQRGRHWATGAPGLPSEPGAGPADVSIPRMGRARATDAPVAQLLPRSRRQTEMNEGQRRAKG